MPKPPQGATQRRPSASGVLENVDRPHPLKIPRVAWVKHGKYIAVGGVGVWYFDILDRIGWSLEVDSWVKWVGRLGVGLHGLTVVSKLLLARVQMG